MTFFFYKRVQPSNDGVLYIFYFSIIQGVRLSLLPWMLKCWHYDLLILLLFTLKGIMTVLCSFFRVYFVFFLLMKRTCLERSLWTLWCFIVCLLLLLFFKEIGEFKMCIIRGRAATVRASTIQSVLLEKKKQTTLATNIIKKPNCHDKNKMRTCTVRNVGFSFPT